MRPPHGQEPTANVLRFVCLTLVASLSAPAALTAPVELLSNGGFEWGNWEWQSVWGHHGHEVVHDEVHAGDACMYFSRQGAIRTLRYAYSGGPIQVTGWCKLRDVKQGKQPWYRFWVTVEYHSADGKGLGHADCLLADGTRDWTRFASRIGPLGDNARFISLSVSLHNCAGEAWVDDLQVRADARLDMPAWKFTGQPYYTGRILPRPTQCSYGEAIPLWDAVGERDCVRVMLGDAPHRGATFGARQIRFRLTACERYLRFFPLEDGAGERVRIYLGHLDDAHIERAARRLGIELPHLGPQEHIVRMAERGDRWDIIAAGADDVGIAYAAASIVQMIGIQDDNLVLRSFDMLDRPTYLLRAGGDYGAISEEFMARLVMLKIPVYPIQHRSWWQLAGPEGPSPGRSLPYAKSLRRMHDFAERTGALDLMFLIHIYTPGGRPLDRTGPVFDIANDEHVGSLVQRLKWLYGLGFRIQMVCVDDYVETCNKEYVCKSEAEQERFGSIGHAHGHLMRHLWEQLSPTCPELKLSIVTGPYSTSHLGSQVTVEAGKRYLRELDEQMPPQVAVCWTGPRITSPRITRADWAKYQSLILGHELYIWDNNEGGAPIPGFDVDFYPGMHEDSAWGLIYSNAHYVGWPHMLPSHLAANDYLSNPDGYDALASHEEAVHKAFGPAPYEHIHTINEGYQRARAMIRGVDFDREELLNTVAGVYESVHVLRDIGAPMSVPLRQMSAAGVVPTIADRLDLLPVGEVRRAAESPVIDGRLDDPAWASAVRLRPFEHYQNSETKTFEGHLYPTDCRLTYDAEALYIACSCHHGDVQLRQHGYIGKRDGPIYFESDAVELFLMPKADSGQYAHLVVDHTGTVFDESRPGGAAWDGKWTWAVTKEPGVWRMEVRVPYEDIGASAPEPGDVWRANICRAFAQEKDQMSCWARIYGSFHNWPFYGHLQFVGED